MDKIEIPYMKYVYYDQWRSVELWLNHTLSILMNYFAFYRPLWWEQREIRGKKYYWLSYNKIKSDIPSIAISDSTLRAHINKLIKEWLLMRELVTDEFNKTKAYYRATEKYTLGDTSVGSNFTTLYNEMDILLREGRVNSTEKDKIAKLLSSYSGKKKKSRTTYDLSDVGWSPILDYLRKEFSLSESWEWAFINIWAEINAEWIRKHIMTQIQEIWVLRWWITLTPTWEPYMWDDIKWKILSKLMTMFEWFKENEVEVKSMKWRINTFFWVDRI